MKTIKILKTEYSLYEVIWVVVFTAAAVVLSILFKETAIGFIAFISGVLCVLLAAKGSKWNYIVGIVNCLAYGYVSFAGKLFGEVILNLAIFLPFQFVGFFLWRKKTNANTGSVIMKKLKVLHLGLILLIATALVILVGWLLSLIEGQATPYIDSFTNVFSVLAMVLMLLRYREAWVAYIIINLATVIMWVLRATAGIENATLMIVMWAAYLINSMYGLYIWTKGVRVGNIDNGNEINEVKNEEV